jgi:hypothetical protein
LAWFLETVYSILLPQRRILFVFDGVQLNREELSSISFASNKAAPVKASKGPNG